MAKIDPMERVLGIYTNPSGSWDFEIQPTGGKFRDGTEWTGYRYRHRMREGITYQTTKGKRKVKTITRKSNPKWQITRTEEGLRSVVQWAHEQGYVISESHYDVRVRRETEERVARDIARVAMLADVARRKEEYERRTKASQLSRLISAL